MPHFYFDTDDGEQSFGDDVGAILAGTDAAKDAAVSALPDIARDVLPDGDRRTFSVTVRNEAGRAIMRASLTLRVEMLEGDPD